MSLHEPAFVLLFLPAVLAGFHLARRFAPAGGAWSLLVASVAFYALGDLASLPFVAGLVIANLGVGRALGARPPGRGRNLLLGAGVALDLGVLAVFKYVAGGDVLPTGQGGGMPLGLSFIVLQQITWLVDLWRRPPGRPPAPWSRFALWSVFFPQMIAGPIFRWDDAEPQYVRDLAPPPAADVARGLSLFVVGLAKKALLADPIGQVADPLFAAAGAGASLGFLEAWIAAWAFLLQLYFDFSALSDMAIGIGLMLGLRLPINFNSPLKARSGSDCFDRWHMSLTAFVRAYVFGPLYAFVRRRAPGKAAQRTLIAWATATILSLSLVGWWHGARPTYVLSGFLIGVAAVLLQLRAAIGAAAPARRPGVAGQAGVLLGLMVFGVFFRAPDLGAAVRVLGGLVQPWTLSLGQRAAALLPAPVQTVFPADGFLPHAAMPASSAWLALAVASGLALLAPNTLQIFNLAGHPGAPAALTAPRLLAWRPSLGWAIACALLLAASIVASVGLGARAALYGVF